jgi:hypothetical protein
VERCVLFTLDLREGGYGEAGNRAP